MYRTQLGSAFLQAIYIYKANTYFHRTTHDIIIVRFEVGAATMDNDLLVCPRCLCSVSSVTNQVFLVMNFEPWKFGIGKWDDAFENHNLDGYFCEMKI